MNFDNIIACTDILKTSSESLFIPLSENAQNKLVYDHSTSTLLASDTKLNCGCSAVDQKFDSDTNYKPSLEVQVSPVVN